MATETRVGLRSVKLISLDDFNGLILYAASKGKKKALALNKALVDMSLRDFFRDAFGERLLTVLMVYQQGTGVANMSVATTVSIRAVSIFTTFNVSRTYSNFNSMAEL